jgi:predicted DNA-binding transcriptional regulator AlpA
MNDIDPAMADALASAFERVAIELRASAGITLASLREREACHEQTDDGMPQLLDAQQVAQMLKLNVRTIRRQVHLGVLPRGVRIGRALRWSRKELENFVKDAES